MVRILTNSKRIMFGISVALLLTVVAGTSQTRNGFSLARELNLQSGSSQSDRRRLAGLRDINKNKIFPASKWMFMTWNKWKKMGASKKWEYATSHPDYFNDVNVCVRCCGGRFTMKNWRDYKKCTRCGQTGECTTTQCPNCAGKKNPCTGTDQVLCDKKSKQWKKALTMKFEHEETKCKLIPINDKCFSYKLFQREAGVEEVFDYHANYNVKVPRGKSAVIITGAGYHTLNALKNGNKGLRGVLPAKKKISAEDQTTTIQNVIEDVSNATSCKIKLPSGNKRNLTTSEIASRKRKVISWLKSLSDFPSTCKIAIVRELKSHDGKNDVKPAWAAQLLKELNGSVRQAEQRTRPVEYILDIGSGKLAFTNVNGMQQLNYDFDENFNIIRKKKNARGEEVTTEITMDEYLTEFVAIYDTRGGFDLRKVAVRFTGKFRSDPTYEQHKTDFTHTLNAREITNVGDLPIEDEARLGSQHGLTLVQPYFEDVNNFVVMELGGGSHQGAYYQRVEHEVRKDLVHSMAYFTFPNKSKCRTDRHHNKQKERAGRMNLIRDLMKKNAIDDIKLLSTDSSKLLCKENQAMMEKFKLLEEQQEEEKRAELELNANGNSVETLALPVETLLRESVTHRDESSLHQQASTPANLEQRKGSIQSHVTNRSQSPSLTSPAGRQSTSITRSRSSTPAPIPAPGVTGSPTKLKVMIPPQSQPNDDPQTQLENLPPINSETQRKLSINGLTEFTEGSRSPSTTVSEVRESSPSHSSNKQADVKEGNNPKLVRKQSVITLQNVDTNTKEHDKQTPVTTTVSRNIAQFTTEPATAKKVDRQWETTQLLKFVNTKKWSGYQKHAKNIKAKNINGEQLLGFCTGSKDKYRSELKAAGFSHRLDTLSKNVLGTRRRLASHHRLENRPIHMLAKLIQQAQA